ncbi:MAG: HAMP domain-containing sensor histidine kinase [Humidesulfovibrio sp.]|nr:HAMP domain-containing sensor histidine kinase [Humidesulfovibrio sp.]
MAGTAQRFRISFNSIKGKILTLFLVAFLVACGLTLLNVLTLAAVRERLNLSERYDDLFNSILEARRFEKNLLIYGGVESQREGMNYLDKADVAVTGLAGDIARVSGPATLEDFRQTLAQYRREFAAISEAKSPERESVRGTGKRLVDMAEKLSATKRARIHKTIFHVSLLPFAYLGIFLVFMAILITVIANSLLKPLGMIGQITARVAKGDFSPVDNEGRHHIEEVAGLLDALNRMALELTANQENLLQARKIAALGTLTAGIAHEINNPINNIMISAESLLETHDESLDDEGREVVTDILSQAERAGEIVRNLLDFSRTEKAGFSALAPDVVLKSTLALVRNQLLIADLKMREDVPHDLALISGNLRHLQQVFVNLLQNAIAATPAGGTIEVSAREAGEFVRLTVRDTGIGIAPENLPHIFEPFYTTKEVGKGTGLGLAVTYSLVKRHSGRIEVESEPGKGTSFHVFLPKAPASPEPHENIGHAG